MKDIDEIYRKGELIDEIKRYSQLTPSIGRQYNNDEIRDYVSKQLSSYYYSRRDSKSMKLFYEYWMVNKYYCGEDLKE